MKHGFTFIELIIVIAIILILSFGVIVNYNTFTNHERLRQAGLTIKSDLRLVLSKVSSGTKSANCTQLISYDVSFQQTCDSDTRSCYTITPRCTNGLLTDEQRVYFLPKEVQIQSANITISFLPLSAGTDLTADTTITLKSSSETYHVTISPSGAISDY